MVLLGRVTHRLFWSAVALITGLVLGFAFLGFSPVPAALCPACFGFAKLDAHIYIEKVPPARAVAFAERVSIAQTRVDAFFGPHPEDARPARMLVCFSDECHRKMGDMGPLAIAYGHHLIYLGPQGVSTEIIAHEQAHIALHRRVGLTNQRKLPAWLDEGIATWVSQDPRFDMNPAHCDVGVGDLPDTYKGWNKRITAADVSSYGYAACRVAILLDEHPLGATPEGLDAVIRSYLPTGEATG